MNLTIIDRMIKQIEFEITTKCNARCPQCVRNYYGSYTWPSLPIKDIDTRCLKKSISKKTWEELEHIKFCGTYGDPCMNKNFLDIIRWVKTMSDAPISIYTNGGMRSKKWWIELANILNQKDKVFFGIDGLEDTNHLHRIGVIWKKLIANVKAFNQAGGTSVWSFLIFKHNQHQIDQARTTALEIGCNEFAVKTTSRFIDKQHKFIKHTEVYNLEGNISHLLEPTSLPEYVNQGYSDHENVIRFYGSYKKYLDKTKIDCGAKKMYNVYVSAEGDVFPCGWLADRLYGYETEKHGDHTKLLGMINDVSRESINLHHTPIEDIVQGKWFDRIEQSWESNELERCAHICGEKSTLIRNANKNLSKICSGPDQKIWATI